MLVKFYAKDLLKLVDRNVDIITDNIEYLIFKPKPFWPWQDKSRYHEYRMEKENMKNKLSRLKKYQKALTDSLVSNSDQDYLVELAHYEYADISTSNCD
jgi:hypothetical protein